ncbi:class I adenylate-forming enzyme family protein [Thalassobium sp. R2A62]|uniref:class I adenylate-forming enzyme family protein n=1 Tax=Thalassobium sp. R2A62 TaxID=633131 RepID=UPI0001B1D623|nr:class I adenylate-forming enzyme family protein [Thalassobium sp. R2A62]EET49245.1 AMP-dependent synthetase and ligase [Thalassobium sp. R2A62]
MTRALPPCPASFNMADYVLTAGRGTPDEIALEHHHPDRVTRYSFDQIEQAIRRAAAILVDHGIKDGDAVLLRLGNTPDFPIAYLAAIAMGARPVPTSTQLTPTELDRIVDDLAPTAVLIDAETSRPTKNVATINVDALRRGTGRLADFIFGDPNRPAYMVYTSGTSGKPRAVVHAHRAIWARQSMHDDWYGMTANDRILHAGAFNWTFTLGTGLMDPWSLGATAIIPADGTDPAQLPQLLHRSNATLFAAAPSIYRKLLKSNGMPDLPHLRHGLSAGEKLPNATRARWTAQTGTLVHEAFGMTECSTFVSGSPVRPAPKGSLGFAQTGRRVSLQDNSIAIHKDDPGLMLGYLNQPQETAAKFNGDWFVTGDVAEIDDDGAVTYLGRDDDMINAGGLRVSPIEIETAVAAHPLIADVAAIAITIKSDVDIIAAFYSAADMIDEAELDALAAETLASYKRPRLWLHQNALPRGANGKLQRRALRLRYEISDDQT